MRLQHRAPIRIRSLPEESQKDHPNRRRKNKGKATTKGKKEKNGGKGKVVTVVKKAVPAPKPARPFKPLRVKKLQMDVYNDSVRHNLTKFSNKFESERRSEIAYDFLRRAYLAALSSQEANPNLPAKEFE